MKKTEREVVKHDKASRIERAKGRTRGMFLVLLERTSNGADRDHAGGDAYLFKVVADENAALVSDGDIKAWLEENEYIGTVHPVRFARGKESGRASFTRSVQQEFSIEKG